MNQSRLIVERSSPDCLGWRGFSVDINTGEEFILSVHPKRYKDELINKVQPETVPSYVI